ncbi:MAG: hypothetical protein M3302_04580 [Actinomycetota bacterium]|nr:hypothetical protein [Actinomycetota bacterium]
MAAVTGEVVLADHSLIDAVPFLIPMLVITLIMVAIVVRDRRRGGGPS